MERSRLNKVEYGIKILYSACDQAGFDLACLRYLPHPKKLVVAMHGNKVSDYLLVVDISKKQQHIIYQFDWSLFDGRSWKDIVTEENIPLCDLEEDVRTMVNELINKAVTHNKSGGIKPKRNKWSF